MATHTYITRSAKTKEVPELSSEIEPLAGQVEIVTLGGSSGEVPSIYPVASEGTTSSALDNGEATVEQVAGPMASTTRGMNMGTSATVVTNKAASLLSIEITDTASTSKPTTYRVPTYMLYETTNTGRDFSLAP